LAPTSEDCLPNWWLRSRKQVTKVRRKAFDSFCLLLSRLLWLERNSRVFRSVSQPPDPLVDVIFEQASLWSSAGLLDSACLFSE
ncbi:hypothetical protein BAE44_0002689, partial [Dichanthelium oligosanthes]